MAKRMGFSVHYALMGTLRGIPPEIRTAILGAAFAKYTGDDDYKLPRKYAAFQYQVDALATEAKTLDGKGAEARAQDALRAREYRARKQVSGACVTENHADAGVTQSVTVERTNELNERTSVNAHVRDGEIGDEDLRIAAHNLGVPPEFALGEFKSEMAKVGWMAMNGGTGQMFPVTRLNLAEILRRWWRAESQKTAPRVPAAGMPADLRASPAELLGD